MEDQIIQEESTRYDRGRGKKNEYTNPYLALVPKIKSSSEKSKPLEENADVLLPERNSPPAGILDSNTGDAAADESEHRILNTEQNSNSIINS